MTGDNMTQLQHKQGVWFVYDGECPICRHAALALRIKSRYGNLSILDARTAESDPLILEIRRRKLDLDEGMVVYVDGVFYHGHTALQFMAKAGKAENFFMRWLKMCFWSTTLSRLAYPLMRSCRNWLLARRGVLPIDNLACKNEPIFKPVFGADWQKLPVVMKKHYGNHPYVDAETSIKGHLDVMGKPPLTWFAPLMELMGQIPIANARNVETTVQFKSNARSKALYFDRTFYFSHKKPYRFCSRMIQIKGNQVVEMMRFGLGWRSRVNWDGEKVVLVHDGYVLSFCGRYVPMPLGIVLGHGYAEEYPIDDNTFEMITHITHPWWGKVYEYKGRFEVVQ